MISIVANIVLLCALIIAPVQAQDRSRDAVSNLEAYAAYKSGNYATAYEIWERLADSGNTTALINLANLFQQGQGVTEDQRRALSYVKRAAKLGDRRAQYELGMAYESGIVIDRDIDQAAYWLKKSADNGSPDGQFAYGVMLATARGKGLKQLTDADKTRALHWLRKAQKNGNLEAKDYIVVLTGASR